MTEQNARWSESAAVDAQVEALLRQLSLDEKIDLVSGKNDVASRPDLASAARAQRLALSLADGPAGVRLPDPANDQRQVTAFPAPIALAATWDPDLARQYGNLIGAEMSATGHNVMLGPAVDIARAPLGGRTFESFGEDPLLQARLVVPEIQAIQAHAVQACLKHYLANNQEHQRNTIDVRVDERALREIYLPPFAAAVRHGGVAAVMGSYNQINGVFACENPQTLTVMLREELGFRGWVMSDFMATHSTVASTQAGLDWELGPRWWGPRLLEAVQAGEVRPELIDEMVRRILRPTIGLGGIASPTRPRLPADLGAQISARWTGTLTAPASGDYTLSLTCLGSGRIYLDNRPLINAPWGTPEQAVTQPTAEQLWTGGGAQIRITTLPMLAGERHTVRIEYAADLPDMGFLYGAQVRFGWRPPAGTVLPDIAAAAELAGRSDIAIVVARTFESEAIDRPSLRLPNEQDQLIRAVAAANPRTIVVLMTGGPVETARWEDDVPAIVEAWFAGQEQGGAVARVLFGDVNPAGKLPLTFPRSLDQTPVATPAQYPGIDGAVHYTEGIFVGYRGCDHLGIEPQYPFGHGLSYTRFAYSRLELTPASSDGTQPIQVRFEVTNTGSRAGTEVAQVYLGLPEVTGEPPKRLAGWARVWLEPGESKWLSVTLEPQSLDRPLSYWNAKSNAWEIGPGDYQVFVGASSRDIRLTQTFRMH